MGDRANQRWQPLAAGAAGSDAGAPSATAHFCVCSACGQARTVVVAAGSNGELRLGHAVDPTPRRVVSELR